MTSQTYTEIKNDNKKPFHYQYEESYEQLVDEIINDYYNEEEHKGDDTWYYDALHEVIDSYVCRYDYEAKEVVDKYGVFNAISDYNDEGMGDFEIDESATKNYMKLYYILIYRFIMDNYTEKLESVSTKDE